MLIWRGLQPQVMARLIAAVAAHRAEAQAAKAVAQKKTNPRPKDR